MASQGISIYTATLVMLGGLVVSAVVALTVFGGSPTAPDQTDSCFGRGQFVEGSTYFFTVSERAAIRFSKYLGIDMTVGETREFRDCQVGEFDSITIDVATNTVVGLYTDYGAIIERATSQPQGTPEAIKLAEELAQENYFPSGVPTNQTPRCDPSWVQATFDQTGVVMCYPADWKVKSDSQKSVLVGTPNVEVGALASGSRSFGTTCRQPDLINVPTGVAELCASGPTEYARVIFAITLPSGRHIGINVYNGAAAEDEALALRIAANVVDLP